MEMYIKGLLAASVVSGIILALAPESASGIKKYVKNIVSLALLCVLISPIVPILSDVESFGEKITESTQILTEPHEVQFDGNTDKSNELILNQSVRNIKKEITNMVKQAFKIGADDIEITLTLIDEDIRNIIISRIDMTILGENANDVTAAFVTEYIKKYFLCECVVTCG